MTSVFEGRFPTDVPVYVWYGEGTSSVVRATVLSDRLLVATAPPASREGVTDISVRFTKGDVHELLLENAFSYQAPSTGGGNPSPSPSPAPAPSPAPSPSPTPAPGPTPSPSPTPSPAPSPAPGPSPSPSPDPSPSPSPAPPPTGGGGSAPPPTGAPSNGEPAIRGQLGSTTLRQIGAGGPLTSLASIAWPSEPCGTSCFARRLG